MSGDLPVLDHTDQGIRVLEEERRRIARDLHDGPAQTLTNVSMRLSVLRTVVQSSPDRALSELDRLNSKLIETINEVRRLIFDLRPVAIDEAGLTSALKELQVKCEGDTRIPIKLDIDEGVTNDIAPAKQVEIYRLIKEILNNMMKHAEASKIMIKMNRSGSDLVTIIRDNGRGFDPKVIPTGHYGLLGMRERAAYLGGSLDIQSTIGHGSEFILRAPVYKVSGEP